MAKNSPIKQAVFYSKDPKTPKFRHVAEYDVSTEMFEIREEEGPIPTIVKALKLKNTPEIEVFDRISMDRETAIWLREAIDVLLSENRPGRKKEEPLPVVNGISIGLEQVDA